VVEAALDAASLMDYIVGPAQAEVPCLIAAILSLVKCPLAAPAATKIFLKVSFMIKWTMNVY
jgi:hypothetical protein